MRLRTLRGRYGLAPPELSRETPSSLHGSELGRIIRGRPDSAFIAEGSAVVVYKGCQNLLGSEDLTVDGPSETFLNTTEMQLTA